MMKFKIIVNGKAYASVEAKSVRAAKIRTSKLVNRDKNLYMNLGGVQLLDCLDRLIAAYSPFFGEWINFDGDGPAYTF